MITHAYCLGTSAAAGWRTRSTLAATRRRHAGSFSLKLVRLMKADAKVGLTGGMDEGYTTRLYGWIGRRYYRTLCEPRARARRDPQDRHVRSGDGSGGRAGAL